MSSLSLVFILLKIIYRLNLVENLCMRREESIYEESQRCMYIQAIEICQKFTPIGAQFILKLMINSCSVTSN